MARQAKKTHLHDDVASLTCAEGSRFSRAWHLSVTEANLFFRFSVSRVSDWKSFSLCSASLFFSSSCVCNDATTSPCAERSCCRSDAISWSFARSCWEFFSLSVSRDTIRWKEMSDRELLKKKHRTSSVHLSIWGWICEYSFYSTVETQSHFTYFHNHQPLSFLFSFEGGLPRVVSFYPNQSAFHAHDVWTFHPGSSSDVHFLCGVYPAPFPTWIHLI